ncbi:MAG: hypothetical protein QXR17_06930 [Candidatus Bathyarchaeia archaeon]
MVVMVILIMSFVFIVGRMVGLFKENRVLKEALRQNEIMLKEKEEQIKILEEKLSILQKEQMNFESKILRLKEQKKVRVREIEEMGDDEVCVAFRKFGYNPICR